MQILNFTQKYTKLIIIQLQNNKIIIDIQKQNTNKIIEANTYSYTTDDRQFLVNVFHTY